MRIVIIFDANLRPDTTGIHFKQALIDEGFDVIHFAPLSNSNGPLHFVGYDALPAGADLYLQIDDDLGYPPPTGFSPTAYYCIDTHRLKMPLLGSSLGRAWKASFFDYTFAAQNDGVDLLGAEGINAFWVPLGFDPVKWFPGTMKDKEFDWSFIGSMSDSRLELCSKLSRKFPNCVFGQSYGDSQLAIYHRSKIILNLPILNDVNMRLFEAIGSGGLLTTRALNNREMELFPDLVTFNDFDELVLEMEYFLRHDESRNRLAASQAREALERHTYRNRV